MQGFRREMTHGDWNILASYAARVLSIEHSFDRGGFNAGIMPDVYLALTKRHPASADPLFPKLRRLRLTNPNEIFHLPMMRAVLLGPELRHLYIEHCLMSPALFFLDNRDQIRSGTSEGKEPKHRLDKTCPMLETLHLDFGSWWYMHDEPISQIFFTLSRLQHLRDVKCGPVNEALLTLLLNNRQINSLDILVPDHTSWLSTSTSNHIYRHLPASLTMTADSYETMERAIKTLIRTHTWTNSSSFSSINLRFSQYRPSKPLELVTEALASCSSASRLTDVEINHPCFFEEDDFDPDEDGDLPAIHYSDLQPLECLGHMTKLSLSFGTISILRQEPSQLLALLGHWPLLRSLEVHPFSLDVPRLIAVLRLLPELAYLNIDIIVQGADFKRLPQKHAYATLPVNSRIRDLSVSLNPSSSSELDSFARFLAHSLPLCLPAIEFAGDWHPSKADYWNKVAEVVRADSLR
ncbi:hypothetical protein CONPUDRAFT_169493 [Coniophora puteana RWD-64-598 SS2]|uniref:F-box domain-containing protein n=1 Tax=Coniophora puteana (strain RWD-64-598) TaxID=741705 RepID=A0A5M3M8D5_CONPW|nr:uncharacterized protein CONPUDRAFT_169493 [Coniophora puteana RWD-64-598 SS2]EIW75060.1 hypothetical protein CONPUDRAFT_169493 [Coniophora puteana RWD-64-598 SS2]